MSATHLATLARTSAPQSMLRRFLALDAAVTGGNALAYLAFGVWALVASGNPFFYIFIVPGAMLAIASLPSRA